ncbi:histone-lysine N-methyltransferase SETMAR-like [Octopus bimaculoides]|uniref:histone-lysine N-methyltransferase SETMAR-like n=1 Tax=Octopus bimaculoides TaxID=37653 RepID=UPI00071E0638|nr:histone-lysine N-methyltransferase SETMAR-like [Octopus bimaculoides]|eukprot:XP_014782532.1 PREDICTED: histone-lysine N-methyltransferase SETMAR-like [Octopus bimaculoides]
MTVTLSPYAETDFPHSRSHGMPLLASNFRSNGAKGKVFTPPIKYQRNTYSQLEFIFRIDIFDVISTKYRIISFFLDKSLLQVIEADPMQTARQLAAQFGAFHVMIINNLHRLGKVSKLGKWVPHELTEANKQARVTACQSLLWRSEIFDCLESVITMDEKWVLYSSVRRIRSWCSKRQQPEPSRKGPLVQEKVMISVWWDCRGVIMLDLLPRNTTVNKNVYCEQIDRLKIALFEKR